MNKCMQGQVGAIGEAHGLRGDVKVIPLTDFIEQRFKKVHMKELSRTIRGHGRRRRRSQALHTSRLSADVIRTLFPFRQEVPYCARTTLRPNLYLLDFSMTYLLAFFSFSGERGSSGLH